MSVNQYRRAGSASRRFGHVNPTGVFARGRDGDCGVTERKVTVDADSGRLRMGQCVLLQGPLLSHGPWSDPSPGKARPDVTARR
jgi:hypothetical protein